MIEVEVYVFLAAVALSIFGVVGSIAKQFYKKDLRIFHYLIVVGVVGALLFPLSFVVALVMGRAGSFASVVFTAPLELLNSIGTGKSYNEACIGGKCAIYCCEGAVDSGVKWKDCNDSCSGKPGVPGKATGDTCQYSDREAYCGDTGLGTGNVHQTNKCNNLPELGPLTCTCCTSTTHGKWWDCKANCSSHHDAVGFPIASEGCVNVKQINCV